MATSRCLECLESSGIIGDFFSQALELSWSIAKSPQLPKTETFFQSHLVEPPKIAQDGDPNVAGESISKNHL